MEREEYGVRKEEKLKMSDGGRNTTYTHCVNKMQQHKKHENSNIIKKGRKVDVHNVGVD